MMPHSRSPISAKVSFYCRIVVVVFSLLSLPNASAGFATTSKYETLCRHSSIAHCSTQVSRHHHVLSDNIKTMEKEADGDDNNEAMELFESNSPLDGLERSWRYARKPLLSIGAKGATLTHGNSLRQLLAAHTVVKVKVHTRKFGGDLVAAFEHLKSLAEDSGAPAGLECLQTREKDSIIMFGMPGTRERIQSGDFPPQP